MDKKITDHQQKTKRMQSIECFRVIASMMVVFIHCEGAGRFGAMMNCLARVGVPFFCVTSGFFSYYAREKSIEKRFWSIVKLTLVAKLMYLLWGCYRLAVTDPGSVLDWIRNLFSATALMEMLLLNVSRTAAHLWYLNSMVFIYAVIWIYVRWSEDGSCSYKPLYIFCVWQYAIHVVLSSFSVASNYYIGYRIYRNGLLTGLPMFVLGLFLREYNEKIISVFHLTKLKLVGLIGVGAFLSLLQLKGVGKVEMPLGALLEVIAVILLCVQMPTISKDSGIVSSVISTFGTLSTYIYITHIFWMNVYHEYIKKYILSLGKTAEDDFDPFVVLGITLATGVLYVSLKAALKRLSGRIKLTRSVKKC